MFTLSAYQALLRTIPSWPTNATTPARQRMVRVVVCVCVLCCASLAWAQAPEGSVGAPSSKAWISSQPSAHMFSAVAAPLGQSSKDMADTWGALVYEDISLMSKVHQCQNNSGGLDTGSACAKEISSMVTSRQASLKRWMPMWRAQAARTKDPILRDRATYQIGVGHLLLGEHSKGIQALKQLIVRVDEGKNCGP